MEQRWLKILGWKNCSFVYFSKPDFFRSKKNKNLLFQIWFGWRNGSLSGSELNDATVRNLLYATTVVADVVVVIVVAGGLWWNAGPLVQTTKTWIRLDSAELSHLIRFNYHLSLERLSFIDATRTKPVEQGCTTQYLNILFAHSRAKY